MEEEEEEALKGLQRENLPGPADLDRKKHFVLFEVLK